MTGGALLLVGGDLGGWVWVGVRGRDVGGGTMWVRLVAW